MLLAALALTGCRPDSDGDGLTDRAEGELGLDPSAADSDADGLSDPAELAAGTDPLDPDTDRDRLLEGDEPRNDADPLIPDTDGDGYLDGDEVVEGKDPADATSLIYAGGWPYYFAKQDLAHFRGDVYEVGKRFLRLEMTDQFGDLVDLFDFYNETRPVVVQVTATWSPNDHDLASYLQGDPNELARFWPAGPGVIARGDVYWITIIAQDVYGAPGSAESVGEWASEYGAALPILADEDYTSADYVQPDRWPTVVLLDPELRVVDTEGFREEHVLAALNEQFPE